MEGLTRVKELCLSNISLSHVESSSHRVITNVTLLPGLKKAYFAIGRGVLLEKSVKRCEGKKGL